MPAVFEYTNYRTFLADYYTERKKSNPGFSYQAFADKVGFPNRGFLYNVITGRKNLSISSAVKLSQAMKLTAAESDYFENLVSFNQAKNLRERNHYFEKLNSIKSSRPGSATVRETRKDQHEFYSTWYYSAIRSLIDMYPFKDDYEWLAKSVYPSIKPIEAKKAVKLLRKMGIVQQRRDGTLEVTDKTITAGSEVIRLGLQNFHTQAMGLALKAIQELPREKRNISGLTMGISRKTYESICEEIATFQTKLQAMAQQDQDADNVYHLNFHFFPVSNINGAATGRQAGPAEERSRG